MLRIRKQNHDRKCLYKFKSLFVQKFMSTTIKRSTLPYPELYTWQECGKFVSDYVKYEPLSKPLKMVSSQTYCCHQTSYFIKLSDKRSLNIYIYFIYIYIFI